MSFTVYVKLCKYKVSDMVKQPVKVSDDTTDTYATVKKAVSCVNHKHRTTTLTSNVNALLELAPWSL